jgi:hypothetical protein
MNYEHSIIHKTYDYARFGQLATYKPVSACTAASSSLLFDKGGYPTVDSKNIRENYCGCRKKAVEQYHDKVQSSGGCRGCKEKYTELCPCDDGDDECVQYHSACWFNFDKK